MRNVPDDSAILAFIERHAGRVPDVTGRADVLAALDLDGRQAEDFMKAFAREFSVALAGYEPAFHHRDAARAARFGWPLAVPPQFGIRLPIAVSTLGMAAREGRWPLRYPLLRPVPVRDWVNWLLVLVALPLVVAGLILIFRLF